MNACQKKLQRPCTRVQKTGFSLLWVPRGLYTVFTEVNFFFFLGLHSINEKVKRKSVMPHNEQDLGELSNGNLRRL